MRIATWNVNSVKSRLSHLLGWLKDDRPDIVLLQEIKCTEDAFPRMEVEELGYNLAIYGQKSYNGVAILSKFPLDDVQRGLPGDEGDDHARYIEAVASLPGSGAMRVASVYVPNGQTADSDKFAYKLRFLDRLDAHIRRLLTYDEMLAVGGDYNIAPDDSDVHDPKYWQGSVLTHDEVRRRFRRILHQGMYDAYRLNHPRDQALGIRDWRNDSPNAQSPMPNPYTWWDYRGGGFAMDNGLRIDHILLSPQAADRLSDCTIEKKLRALDKASDHAPVMASFSL